MPRGGKRKGAGKPKGYKHQATLDKIAAREVVRQFVTANLQPMLEAQLAHAIGLKYLIARDKKTGKFIRLTEDAAASMLEKGDDGSRYLIEVWEKDPSVQAFTDLLNRALDKPKEQEQEIKVSGDADLIARLHAARKRLAEAVD